MVDTNVSKWSYIPRGSKAISPILSSTFPGIMSIFSTVPTKDFYPEEVVMCHMLLDVVPPDVGNTLIGVPPGDDSCPGEQQVSTCIRSSVQRPPRLRFPVGS